MPVHDLRFLHWVSAMVLMGLCSFDLMCTSCRTVCSIVSFSCHRSSPITLATQLGGIYNREAWAWYIKAVLLGRHISVIID
jgi:hypothetical protein